MYRKREQARRGQEHGVFARFRYIDLKEAARGCGGRGPLWELNGVEWCCEGTPGLCRRARQTAAGAWKVVGAKSVANRVFGEAGRSDLFGGKAQGDGACRNTRSTRVVESRFMRQQ